MTSLLPPSDRAGLHRPAPSSAQLSAAVGAPANGEFLKREGQQMALDFAGDWKDSVTLEFRAWLAVQKAKGLTWITIEQFRSQAKSQPRSHKAWGALPRVLCRLGLILATGEYVRAASPRTHAHPVAKWAIA